MEALHAQHDVTLLELGPSLPSTTCTSAMTRYRASSTGAAWRGHCPCSSPAAAGSTSTGASTGTTWSESPTARWTSRVLARTPGRWRRGPASLAARDHPLPLATPLRHRLATRYIADPMATRHLAPLPSRWNGAPSQASPHHPHGCPRMHWTWACSARAAAGPRSVLRPRACPPARGRVTTSRHTRGRPRPRSWGTAATPPSMHQAQRRSLAVSCDTPMTWAISSSVRPNDPLRSVSP